MNKLLMSFFALTIFAFIGCEKSEVPGTEARKSTKDIIAYNIFCDVGTLYFYEPSFDSNGLDVDFEYHGPAKNNVCLGDPSTIEWEMYAQLNPWDDPVVVFTGTGDISNVAIDSDVEYRVYVRNMEKSMPAFHVIEENLVTYNFRISLVNGDLVVTDAVPGFLNNGGIPVNQVYFP